VPPPGAIALDESMHSHALHAVQRPEVNAAAARVARERAALTLAAREGVPVPRVGLAFDHYWSEKPLQTSVTLSLSLPLLGRAGATRREAEAALAGAEAGARAVSDRVAAEIAQAEARAGAAEHGVETLRDRVVPARERAFRAAQSEYVSGSLDMSSALAAAR